jgi:hypothetical protein
MQVNLDPGNRRHLIQTVGCLSCVVGAAAVAGLAMMIWQLV